MPIAPAVLPRFLSRLFSPATSGADELVAGPIRGELLGTEQLAARARAVARGQRLATGLGGRRRARLLARLHGTHRILEAAHARLSGLCSEADVGPAGEWLLDNYHIVREHIHEVHESLPRGYYRELPELASGPLAGYPRVYELAISLISHTEGRIDLDNTHLFLTAFQEIAPLSIGELWAVPAMLRLGLIESVRRMALRTVERLDEMEEADRWADRLHQASEEGPDALSATLKDFVMASRSLTPIFVSRFLHQLRMGAGAAPILLWLEQWISEEGLSPDDAATRSTQRLALTQITMANSILSLRAVAQLDWRAFVEQQSVLDRALRRDPSGFYSRMTFATRDHYRHVIERIAKRTGAGEEAVALNAIRLAEQAAGTPRPDPRRSHVGYYLIDGGRIALEQISRYRPAPREAIHRLILCYPNAVFVGGMVAGTVLSLAALLWLGGPAARSAWLIVLLIGLIPANDIAVNLLNLLVTTFLAPRGLPRLDLRVGGIPTEYRTAVVIPTLFDSVEAVHEALANLEVQFLANRNGQVHFAVLSDFTDAATETADGDEVILAAAAQGVRALNARYAPDRSDAFYLFHRSRRWNPQQGVWMGWERKRGKLAEFNRFLRGTDAGAFSTIIGEVAPLRGVRYVITLDADTLLPPDAAAALVGILAHPLNRADYDAELGRVVRGYGILQPRVGVSLPSAHRSRFAAIHSGHPGVDPYTTAVSDVYQDLFGEGSFTGKGIYDVDAFEQATHGRFPENRLLSHDLIEGSFARAGLATDVTVYDDYPTRYLTYTRRKHRWIRGDWQLLQWVTPWVPGPLGIERNRLSLLSRWRILDNLRRSTVEIALLLFLVAGWTMLPGSPIRWTLLGLGALAMPWLLGLGFALLTPPLDKSWRAYYEAVWQDAAISARQVALALVVLPHQAWISADAICRTLWRLFVSRKNLLEWQTASLTESLVTDSVAATWRSMRPATVLAVGIVLLVGAVAGLTTPSAPLWAYGLTLVPLALVWLSAPGGVHVLSAPQVRRERRLPAGLRRKVMRYALLHWRFFDRFVSAETNWLAPDNFQDDPAPVLAMRSSPTNIGLQLLATVSAYHLGFLTPQRMTELLELAFGSLARLSRQHGHFLNWYDLQDLRVLEPAYISTVDSGNLAGHLIAVRQACLAIRNEPAFDARVWRAADAALGLADERLRSVRPGEAVDSAAAARAVTSIAAELRALREAVGQLVRDSTTRETRAAAGKDTHRDALERIAVAAQALSERLIHIPLPAHAAEAVAEWIDWTARLVADHRARFDAAAGPRAETFGALARRSPDAARLLARLDDLADQARDFAMAMDFRVLYDDSRELFAIGYQMASHSLDTSYYDLLASEARLASFIAIAKGDVPVDHWFHLGRTLTHAAGATALVSWSGSMFEYLMPLLVMQSFPHTVLDQTCHGAVRRHQAYGAERGVPWGLSESAYNLRDRHLTYQYRAFGVPDLALKRGLARDLVVAPYASALATMVDAERSLDNLAVLEKKGALGRYGFRDALDYTRPQPGERYTVVQTYMAHHIGMSFVALANTLLAKLWQRRFHAEAMVRSTELLLHERVPRRLALQEPVASSLDEPRSETGPVRPAVREIDTPDTPQPKVALLGHLPYTLMVSHCGGGYSQYEDRLVTRWRADGTRDDTGQFCYLKDIRRGRAWSAAHQPLCTPADWYRAVLATDRVTFHRADGAIETRTEIAVVPEDSAEVRRVTVTNNGHEPREIELTSYGEVVLAPAGADRAHPAFSNLFVETQWHEWCTAITAARRPRAAGEPALWCVHVAATGKELVGAVTCETDRCRFLGRGRSTRDPLALELDGPLSGTTGAVLDPIFSLRARVRVAPGQSASVSFTTLVATNRDRAFELADRYHDPHAAQRALDLAWTSSQIELRELDVTPQDAVVFQEIAGSLFYANPALRASAEELARNQGAQQRLWANGLSGDWPILLATIDSVLGLPTLRQLFAAHRYWRRRGMMVDLVILNAHPHSYLQELNDQIIASMIAASDTGVLDRPGGVFVRPRDLLHEDDLLMLSATARVHIPCDGRTLSRILDSALIPDDEPTDAREVPAELPRMLERGSAQVSSMVDLIRSHAARIIPEWVPTPWSARASPRPGTDGHPDPAAGPLLFDNGLGGITADGDYRIRLDGTRLPPAPWANVIANPRGGFIVTELGAGCTWAENSLFYRLSPWHNDPVSDPMGEVLYLRDEETGELWSATPAPIRHPTPYTITHGAGQSVFAHEHAGIATTLTLGLAEAEPVKLSMLRVTNRDTRKRRITVTAYVEWTLGAMREHTQHQVHTSFAPESGAILAQNPFDPQFAGWVAFLALTEPLTGHTGDRQAFLGRNGTLRAPAGLMGVTLSGTTGAGLDPCGVLQCQLTLAAGESREIAVLLGAAPDDATARRTLATYRQVGRARAALTRSVTGWAERLATITVRTPEPSFDAMLNRWTLYQALACRMWARSAVYQSSGAYGFRDQLQDVMALVYAEPALAREHLLRAAARQFPEGDVQHWWHPQSGRGVRTRFSDDLAWLPYVVDHYLRTTADHSLLDEEIPFLSMRPLEPHEHELYDLPEVSAERASVYQHCLRALTRACTRGAHGLPLIGTGDWNDGMSRVGPEGQGESVWLAWFLIATLRAFAPHVERRGEHAVAAGLLAQANEYVTAVETHGWDGAWYRRAYFDDGTPLGTSEAAECRIDSIAQSWSVISGAGCAARQETAMRSLEEHLVLEEARILPLLTPPFDRSVPDPGYIKGYLPGVRENGAQYTHAALWAVMATALQGRGDRAFTLYQMLNPLTRTDTPTGAETYKVEPYVVAADVYTAVGQLGRGGWTWYTGSASWMYRVGLETILGFCKTGASLTLKPCIPAGWREYGIAYRHGRSRYDIVVSNPDGLSGGPVAITLDGTLLTTPVIPLVDDGMEHAVMVRILAT